MRLLFAFVFLLIAMPANAQTYAQLTYSNVLKTLARFDALNLQNDKLLDDYMKFNDCDAFYKNYRDDFARQKRRIEMREKVKQERSDYADAYYFTSEMFLDRYDFTTRQFRLKEKSVLRNINSFMLVHLEGRGICIDSEKVDLVPDEIGATLDQPVTIEGLPISEDQSKKLIETMNKAKNYDRKIYARFSLMIVYAPPMNTVAKVGRFNTDAQLLSIEFFEDAKMTKPIWIYTRA